MPELIPLHDYVVIQEGDAVVEESSISKLGLVLPDGMDSEDMKSQGKVIRVPKVNPMLQIIPFQEGDYVVFKRHMFEDIKLGANRYLLGKLENVIAIIKV